MRSLFQFMSATVAQYTKVQSWCSAETEMTTKRRPGSRTEMLGGGW